MATKSPDPSPAAACQYGPHTAHVERLLAALADPAVRRRPIHGRPELRSRSRHGVTAYEAARESLRLEHWDAARFAAADVATPTQRFHAAGVALAIVVSDLIDDETWSYFTETPLASRIDIERPGGPLAERCACGNQLGQRLLAARLATTTGTARIRRVQSVGPCDHTTPSLPTRSALEVAMTLCPSWEDPDWVALIDVSRSFG